MKPYYEQDGVTIYHGDCREILPELPDKSIDLGITSPPFNLGNDHHTGSYRHQMYDDELPEEVYQARQVEVLKAIYAIVKDTGSFFYQHKNRIRGGLQISPYEWLFKTPWLIKQEIVWNNGSQAFDPIRFYPMTERIYWLAKSSTTKLINELNLTDDWHLQPMGTRGHFTRAYPEQIPSYIISSFPQAQLILDPFLGSGTTAYCAKKLNRKCIGIEIEEKYCEIAAKRCSQSVMRLEV